MFIFDTIITESFSFEADWYKVLISMGVSIVYGFLLTLLYRYYRKNKGISADMPISILVMPILVTSIVLISRIIGIESSALRTTLGFSFAGILAMTRLRSVQKDMTDLLFITFTIALGFLSGFGYLFYSFIVLVLASGTIILMTKLKLDEPSNKEMSLKVIVPESLNYDNLFDDLLNEYTNRWNLKSVKTADFGTVFELNYIINLKDINQKEFIDKIRERNGNLNVSLSLRKYEA